MKRLLFLSLLPLACLAADTPQEIEGWKVFNGKWEGTKKCLRSLSGTIILQETTAKSIEFACTVQIKSFAKEDGLFALFWGWDGSAENFNARNQLAVSAASMRIGNYHSVGEIKRVKFDWPVGKPVKVKGKILPTSAMFVIGGNQIAAQNLNGMQNFALHVSGADVTFDNISIRAR